MQLNANSLGKPGPNINSKRAFKKNMKRSFLLFQTKIADRRKIAIATSQS
jgi:hypothetical protein